MQYQRDENSIVVKSAGSDQSDRIRVPEEQRVLDISPFSLSRSEVPAILEKAVIDERSNEFRNSIAANIYSSIRTEPGKYGLDITDLKIPHSDIVGVAEPNVLVAVGAGYQERVVSRMDPASGNMLDEWLPAIVIEVDGSLRVGNGESAASFGGLSGSIGRARGSQISDLAITPDFGVAIAVFTTVRGEQETGSEVVVIDIDDRSEVVRMASGQNTVSATMDASAQCLVWVNVDGDKGSSEVFSASIAGGEPTRIMQASSGERDKLVTIADPGPQPG